MATKYIYTVIMIVLVLITSSCKNKTEHNNQESQKIQDSEEDQGVNYAEDEKFEKIYVFPGELTDSMISRIQNMGDPFIRYEAVDRIFTSGKELSSENEYKKIFFRKAVDLSVIHLCVLYPDPYNDFIYDASWFALGGGEKVVTVFQYRQDTQNDLRNKNLLVIISQDIEGNYFTDIFGEDCGMRYCSVGRFCKKDDEYIDFFKDVKSVGDFRKKFPEYLKIIE
jgi:hypothetical protein